MDKTINIKIDTTKFLKPTLQDINKAKNFILKREYTSNSLGTRIDNILTNAAGEIAQICLMYNIPAKSFKLTTNKQMFAQIEEVMNRIEDEIMTLIVEYSVKNTKSEKSKKAIVAYIASLGRRNNTLQDTLRGYLFRYLYDLEALIAAIKLSMENNSNLTKSAAIAKIKSSLHSVYATPEVRLAMSKKNIIAMQAMYLLSHGNHSVDNVPLSSIGASSSNAVNVINMAKTTMNMAWMREQLMEFESSNVEYYYQQRGSSYPCSLCDAEVGLHKADINEEYPHPNCKCWRVPIFTIEQLERAEKSNGSTFKEPNM